MRGGEEKQGFVTVVSPHATSTTGKNEGTHHGCVIVNINCQGDIGVFPWNEHPVCGLDAQPPLAETGVFRFIRETPVCDDLPRMRSIAT